MDIILPQQDEFNPAIWYFKLGGIAADGLYRLADLSRETTSPADWLAANQAEAQSLIDAGVYHEEFVQRRDLADLNEKRLAEITFLQGAIDNWAGLSAGQKDAVLKRLVQEQLAFLRQGLPFIARRLV